MNLSQNASSNQENNVEQKQVETKTQSIAFIDTTVPDYQTLIAGINAEIEIVLLDSTRDGVEQISSVLANRSEVTSLHIISHGRDGAAQLGTAQLSLNNLDKYTNQLQQWKSALTKGADILLYGCDIAAGDAGKAFVQRLGEITQADVAASNDLTGNKLLGGDWELEVQTGQIKAPLLLSQKAQEAFLALLNTQQTKLIASDGAANDWFGNSVAISSDGNTALVGSRLDDTGSNSNQGSAYIFKWNGSQWVQTKLVASDGAGSDLFGYSVAMSNDGNTALVGSILDSTNTVSAHGAAYFFKWNGSQWVQTKLTASDGAAGDQFGYSVAMSGDGNTALIGSMLDDTGSNSDQGSAYIFKWNGSQWVETKLTASDGAANDWFGNSVAISSDGNTALVGSLFDDTGSNSNQGSVYIFKWNGSQWVQTKLTASDSAATDTFGNSVAISSDGNTILVGSLGNDTGSNSDQGSAYIFKWNGSQWLQTKLIASDGAANDMFGSSVTISSDGNTALIGSRLDNIGSNSDQGSAYIFKWNGSQWLETKLTASDGAASDEFGNSVAISSNGNTALVGSRQDDTGSNSDQGSAYIFSSNSVNSPPIIILPAFAPTYTENAAPLLIDATATVTDIDSLNFDTGALTVRFSSGGTADDRLSIRNEGTGANQINLDGKEIYYGSTKIGFFQGGIGTDNLVISLNASATPPATEALVRNITYANTSQNSSTVSRTVEFALTDGDGGTSSAVTKTITFTGINDAPLVGTTTVLYDGALGGAPQDQGLKYFGSGITPTASGGVTNLNTLGSNTFQAGFSNYIGTTNFSSFVLDRTAGYTISFAARVIDEARGSGANKNNDGKDDRAGFSIIVLSSDKKGIELGFWKDRIWAQDDGTTQKNPSLEPDTAPASNFRTFFTQAEGVNFTTNTVTPVNYDLTVLGDTYTLNAFGNVILSGKLRDYTAFPNSPLDVYENPNFLFFGDNTPSARANIDLARIAVTTNANNIPTQTINEDTATVAIPFTISDFETAVGSLTITPSSSNTALVANSGIVVNGTGTNRTVTVTPNANQNGTATITLDVNDGNQTTSRTFNVNVNPVNDAPVLDNTFAPTLTAVSEDPTTNDGTLVSALIGNTISDVDTGAIKGIAVTGVDNTNGKWQYSTNGGTSWSDFSVSATSATLLRDTANDLIRFVPNANYNGAATITYHAWDASDGNTSGTININPGAGGGSSAFSTDAETASITINPVNDAPVKEFYVDLKATDASAGTATWTNYGILGNFNEVGNPLFVQNVENTGIAGVFFNGTTDAYIGPNTVADIDGSSDRTVEVWMFNPSIDSLEESIVTSGQRGSTRRNFTLNHGSSPSFGAGAHWGDDLGWNTPNGIPTVGSWHHFVYTSDGNTTARVYVNGQLFSSVALGSPLDTFRNTINLAVQRRYDNPAVLAFTSEFDPSAQMAFSGYIASVRVHGGVLTDRQIINNFNSGQNTPSVSLVDGLEDNSYTINASDLLFGFSDADGDTVSVANLTATNGAIAVNNNRTFTFTPNANFNGLVTLSYDVVDGNGGLIAATQSFSITAVNDAPVLDNTFAPTLTPISEDPTTNDGTLVSALIGNTISDVDTGAIKGIAVTGVDNTNGKWQYSTNGGTSWSDFTVSATNATLLKDTANDLIRFVPNANYNGAATITYRAWDASDGNASGTTNVDPGAGGGISAFSTAAETASITIDAVNDAPVIAYARSATFYSADITTRDAWRTTTVSKTFDADGDNIYGTDGYYLFYGRTINSESTSPNTSLYNPPNYATVSFPPGILYYAAPPGFYVQIDDPTQTGSGSVPNIDTGVIYNRPGAFAETSWLDITFNQSGTYRIGVITDHAQPLLVNPIDLRLHLVGGMIDTGFKPIIDPNVNGDYYFFDVSVRDGDVYRLSGRNDAVDSNGIGGIFFDTLPAASPTVNLNQVTEDTVSPNGDTISNLCNSIFSDPDAGATLSGIAVVGNSADAATQGIWQYSTDGTNWLDVGIVAEGTTALALSATTKVRFVPVANYNGTPPALNIRLLDNTYSSFTDGLTRINIDTTNSGGTTAISATTSAISISITPVADITGVTSTNINGSYKEGDIISITVTFDEVVNVTGTPQLTLETGTADAVINYSSGSGTNTLTFNYTVAAGQTSLDLDYISTAALSLNGGTIKNAALIDANLTLPVPAATGSLGANKDIVIQPIVSIAALTSTATEGGSNGVYRISRNSTDGDLTVNLAVDASSTTISSDYTLSSGGLSAVIADGQSSVDIILTPTDDTLPETDETLKLNLVTGTGYVINSAANNATVTIAASDPITYNLSTATSSVNELNAGKQTLTFTVTRSGGVGVESTIDYAIGGTATLDSDYNNLQIAGVASSLSGTLNFAAGETTKAITLDLLGDTGYEFDETITLNISNPNKTTAPENSTITNGNALVNVINDDAKPDITVSNITVAEGNSGITNAIFTVNLSAAAGVPVTVDYSTANNTATAGVDYTAVSGTLTFNPGATTQNITVPIIGDFVDELDETFFINLANATNANITNIQAQATITDNDTARFTITPVTGLTTTEAGGTASFTIRLNSQPTASVSLGLTSSNISEGTISTGNIIFTSANWNNLQTITVTGVDDTQIDSNIAYKVITSAAISNDTNYNGMNPVDIEVTNFDNDRPVNQIGGSNLSEILSGTDLSDSVFGFGGNDIITGGFGADLIDAGDGNDTVYGDFNSSVTSTVFNMNDTIYGGRGTDKLYGGAGDDLLYGGEDSDQLWGDAGNDKLWGGLGSDSLTGGAGNDTFVLASGEGTDTIRDFQVGQDLIGLSGGMTYSAITITQRINNTFITDNSNNQVLAILTGINSSSLGSNSFIQM